VACTAIDDLSLDRPLSWRPAKLVVHPHPRQLNLKKFRVFFMGARNTFKSNKVWVHIGECCERQEGIY
jgi:hypothetical protein